MRKMSLRILAASLFALLSVALAPPALAQDAADLSGTTKDAAGAVIPGVKVTARNTATNLTRETQSDEQGRYAFPNLPIGSYEVTASYKGFQTTKMTTQLNVGQQAELDITLSPGGIAENVVVEAGEQQLAPDTETPTVGPLVSRPPVENPPLNR